MPWEEEEGTEVFQEGDLCLKVCAGVAAPEGVSREGARLMCWWVSCRPSHGGRELLAAGLEEKFRREVGTKVQSCPHTSGNCLCPWGQQDEAVCGQVSPQLTQARCSWR